MIRFYYRRLTHLFTASLFVLFVFTQASAQIAVQDFDANNTMAYTNTGGAVYTGSSATNAAPASATFYTSSNSAFGVSGGSSTVTFANVTGLASYNTKYFEFRLASWSINSTGNGADAGDNIIVSVSLDNSTYTQELRINGNANATWHYTTGTGVASVTYDGDGTAAVFAPSGGGARTADGYSTVRVNLPNSCTQARIRVAMLNDAANERWTIDDVKLMGTLNTACAVGAAPTNDATAFAASAGCNNATLSLTAGNGAKRIVVVSASNFSNVPSNATAYSANAAFGSGSTVGAGNYVVYNGTGNSVSVTGLAQNTTYYAKVFEYNGSGTNCDESYLTTSPASITFNTHPAAAPTTPATNMAATPDCNTASLSLTAGNGAKRIIVVSASNFTDIPLNGTNYTASNTFGSGSQVGPGNYVVYNGTGNSVNITGLSAGTAYYVKVFEFNGTTVNCSESYLTAGINSISFSTVSATAPTAPASNLSAVPECFSAAITLTAGNGANRLIVISTADFTDVPANGTAYSANAAFGSGSQVGTGNYVVYKGTGTSVTATNLSSATTYYVRVFEFNAGATANCSEAYLTSGVTSFSFTTPDNCATPQIRSILVNACGAGSEEGLNEYVLVQNGSNPLAVSDISMTYNSAGTYCGTCAASNSIVNNPSFINTLNSTAGCALFQYADPIPAGAPIIIFTGYNPTYSYDFSAQCPATTVFYALFNNNSSGSGRFVNSGTSNLSMSFGSSTDAVSYTLSSSTDGTFADFTDAGVQSTRVASNCAYPLGVELNGFNAATGSSGVELTWETLSEKNADYFDILRAGPDMAFESIGEVKCAGNSDALNNYRFVDKYPLTGLNYYKLNQVDFDGKSENSAVVAVDMTLEMAVSYLYGAKILLFSEELAEGSKVSIFDLNGHCISEICITDRTSSVPVNLERGIYFVTVSNGEALGLKAKIAVVGD